MWKQHATQRWKMVEHVVENVVEDWGMLAR
jgi:hypothetical protein